VPVTLPPVLPADVEVWVGAADQHPGVRRARVALDVATLETEKARAAEKFTLDAVGSVGRHGPAAAAVGHARHHANASVGVQFNLPLYTGGADAEPHPGNPVAGREGAPGPGRARRGVTQATRVAFFGVQSGLAQVKALEAAESSSLLALEATQLGYRVGVRVNLDVLNAQTALFQTQRDLAKARYDVLMGGLRLRQASGQLTAADIDAVNALLAGRA
jgi:outer membrane protein